MMERAKTLCLAVLIAASLVQSYLLAYSEPKFDTIIPTDYVESKLEGTQAELAALLFPKDIVLHFGNGEHTLLYPHMIFYRMILEVVEQRTFDGLREAAFASETAQDAAGVEIRFAGELPLSLLQQAMNLKGEGLHAAAPIDRIHIFTQPGREDVRVFFVGSDGAYEATRADLTVKDVERFVGFGEARTRYTAASGGHYLPDEPLPMVQYTYESRRFTADQLQRSLFPDPFSTRNLTERDGSEIYTDGKRGLQLSTEREWFSYTDPAATAEGERTALETALSAVQFVNRHGGWNGDYMLESIRQDQPNGAEQSVVFRHYVGTYPGSYPIIGTRNGAPFGPIELTLRNRNVTSYERSTVQLDGQPVGRMPLHLPGGDRLLKLWNAYSEKALVRAIFPAYRANFAEDRVVLEPIWALSMIDGSVRALPGGGAY
ncbi:YycH family regulatory protein [Paenibacillus sp.]|uniref:YycH family regulatory protein n=1 Tax=Paenibacillus sp. TaxID=58172 RepID=UPI002D2E8D2A|nr:two-component system activity regulator YycH [Paenibacillus sp.]HZG84872.1 two-component system activity regulator YycH [Paenibacillus sp.]